MFTHENEIKELIELLDSSLKNRLKKFVLYGSVARQTESTESDIDCLVIVDSIDLNVIEVIDDAAANMLVKYGIVFSIIPVIEKNYAEQKYNPLYINVERDGVVLWPKTA